LLSDKIETVEPGFGIELMRLAATLVEPLRARQTITSLVDEPDEDVVRSNRQQTKLTPLWREGPLIARP
jgi:hypothetical protein